MPRVESVVWSPEAEQDLFEIWNYLVREASTPVADQQLRAIDEAVRRLVDWPEPGGSRAEILPRMRSLVVGPYVVFHRVSSRSVEVVRVLHGRRDVDAIFSDTTR